MWVNSPPFPTHSHYRSESSIFAFWIRDSEPRRCCTLWIEIKITRVDSFSSSFFRIHLKLFLMEMVPGFNAWECSGKKTKKKIAFITTIFFSLFNVICSWKKRRINCESTTLKDARRVIIKVFKSLQWHN